MKKATYFSAAGAVLLDVLKYNDNGTVDLARPGSLVACVEACEVSPVAADGRCVLADAAAPVEVVSAPPVEVVNAPPVEVVSPVDPALMDAVLKTDQAANAACEALGAVQAEFAVAKGAARLKLAETVKDARAAADAADAARNAALAELHAAEAAAKLPPV